MKEALIQKVKEKKLKMKVYIDAHKDSDQSDIESIKSDLNQENNKLNFNEDDEKDKLKVKSIKPLTYDKCIDILFDYKYHFINYKQIKK